MLFIDLPGMLREIVRDALRSEDDLVLADEVSVDVPIADAIDEAQADVVVLEADHPELAHSEVPSLLRGRAAPPRLLAVGVDGREAFQYALRPVRLALGELSPERLLMAIRSEATAGSRPGSRRTCPEVTNTQRTRGAPS